MDEAFDNDAGGHREVEIPVPIPNTEVKHPCADDTATSGKVGDCRLFYFKTESWCLEGFPPGACCSRGWGAAGSAQRGPRETGFLVFKPEYAGRGLCSAAVFVMGRDPLEP